MKGATGQRTPMGRLLERFSFDAIKLRHRQEHDREQARGLEISKAKSHVRHDLQRPKPTTPRHTKAVVKRREKKKGIVRKNRTKRQRYLRKQRARIDA